MKTIILLLILLTTLTPLAFAQQAPASIAQQLYSFSPMAQIYLKHLGLADKNSTRYNVMLFAKSYSLTNNKEGFEKAKSFLNKYYGKDKQAKEFLEYYAMGE